MRQSNSEERLGDAGVVEYADLGRKGDRCGKRPNGKVRALRHQHHVGVCRRGHASRAKRPYAGDGPEQRRFAGAGRPGDENTVAGGKCQVFGGNYRLAGWQPDI